MTKARPWRDQGKRQEARVSPRSMAGSPNASTARTEVKVLLDQLS